MPVLWANLIQAVIFLAPHLVLLFIAPAQWPLLVLIFVSALFVGWLQIRSGSILAPWLIHGGANLVVTLSVLIRTMPSWPERTPSPLGKKRSMSKARFCLRMK